MPEIDWEAVFAFGTSPLEIVLRGTLMYWLLFVLFRFVIRRDVGAVGIADVLLIVLIADAAQNGMAGDYKSVSEGAVLVLTLVGWNVLIDMLCWRFPKVEKLFEPPPLPLVRDGRMLTANMKREWVTRDELMMKLREQGVERLDEVRRACLETDGSLSVLRRPEDRDGEPEPDASEQGRKGRRF